MKIQRGTLLAGLSVIGMAAMLIAPAGAQSSDVKEKPPLYTYISNWDIPRAQWADMEKSNTSDLAALSKALSGGTIVAYGNDIELVHTPDGWTHDQWWSAMSMAGLINVLEQFYQSGSSTMPVLSSATRHYDEIVVSRYYNMHSGSIKNGYTHLGFYKLKADAPDDALDQLSKNLVVPLLEKELAAGTISAYQIGGEAIHTSAPGTFAIVYTAASADGLDKVQADVITAIKSNPLGGAAFGSMTDNAGHRDDLVRTNATYK